MIQLELTDDDTEQQALVCDDCLRAWFRTGDADGNRLRATAATKGWQINHVGDFCPRCADRRSRANQGDPRA